jgi:hypothetical protein
MPASSGLLQPASKRRFQTTNPDSLLRLPGFVV